jgi:DNA-binding SARP family transcriptional activator/TolB-like protein/Tfp pilus assembly protein PilF
MGKRVTTTRRRRRPAAGGRLEIQLLGPTVIRKDGVSLPLPRSRKVRALLAYLALAERPVSRSRLCDLLWDTPNDPRGELRWCLSKLRTLLDDCGRARVIATAPDLVGLDLSDCRVDALELERAGRADPRSREPARLVELAAASRGELLEGATVDGSAELSAWLMAQRERLRTLQISIHRALAGDAALAAEARLAHVSEWLRRAPFDVEAHATLLAALVERGAAREAEEHVTQAIRAFEREGLDWSTLRERWRALTTGPGRVTSGEPAPAPTLTEVARGPRRASVAVMPFVEREPAAGAGSVGDGLTEDIITRLAKLRVLFVIARGTTYALAARGVDAHEAGRLLQVDYLVCGSVRRLADRLAVHVELVETQRGRIVWTDTLEGGADETFSVLDAIVDRIVASVAEEIERAECDRALLKPPTSLDAWEAYHLGLVHMYRFTGPDNERAAALFERALELDPSFARAHAGLSFTHFQNAFLDLVPDRARQIDLALRAAERSLSADARDPAAHWSMGRALWLRDERAASFSELREAVALSPNFALGHYTLGFVYSQAGDPRAAIASASYSAQLSPFDPLQFAMLASRALAHLRLEERDEAADLAVRATGRPNAHVHILAIAVESLALAGRREEARRFAARIRERVPGYGIEDFLRAFRFDAAMNRRLRLAARRVGFEGGRG